MILTIDVPKELENKLQLEAERNGVSRDEFVRIVLEEKHNPKPARPKFPSTIIATDLPLRDRSREHDWLEKHRDEYDGQWVVLDGNKLIAAGFDGKEVARKVRELGINGVYVVFVEGSNRPRFISGGVW
ncbi:MAG: hypothetical protein H0X15_08825 [Acidobacteria bacterium]|jgi:hypothetical protein|nr:hypothetical protein [Acidobacteriota bacterium]MBA3785623.1 hypothetical protein [Acidobacteriota bacterium]MBA4121699.1 hypothetical protein [Acidobacteriota bacterium]MBA4184709.1 hypothetical protein [Acidobacteriota bacterium]